MINLSANGCTDVPQGRRPTRGGLQQVPADRDHAREAVGQRVPVAGEGDQLVIRPPVGLGLPYPAFGPLQGLGVRPTPSSSRAMTRWVWPFGARSAAWTATSASMLPPSAFRRRSIRYFSVHALGLIRQAATTISRARVQPGSPRTSR
ncbi:hypothetical protein ADK59_25030 [Streptomyces sp. XY332]|nr:hypothetical protein ADK59_25030 [Streptomyces sp. XY332]